MRWRVEGAPLRKKRFSGLCAPMWFAVNHGSSKPHLPLADQFSVVLRTSWFRSPQASGVPLIAFLPYSEDDLFVFH